jgi:hypothetical protein
MFGDFGATTPHPKTPTLLRCVIGDALYRNCKGRVGATQYALEEVPVKNSTIRGLVVAVALLAAVSACKGKETAREETTATIAPAKPQPAETGTDAMTQTVELGDGRPVSEGGVSTDATATAPATDTAATAPMTENPTTTTVSTTTR